MTPYHATAADRLKAIEARPYFEQRFAFVADPMARALSWKRDRWYAERRLTEIASDDDARWNNLTDMRAEAAERHRLIIERLWATRFADRAQARMLKLADDCANTTAVLVREMA